MSIKPLHDRVGVVRLRQEVQVADRLAAATQGARLDDAGDEE